MILRDADIQSFIEAWRKDFDEEIAEENARVLAVRLVSLIGQIEVSCSNDQETGEAVSRSNLPSHE